MKNVIKKILNAIAFGILFIWQLPQNLVALVMMPFLGKLNKVRYDKCTFAFKGQKMRGGISLGNFIFLDSYLAKRNTSIGHEYGHCWDSKVMGPLYLFIIGIPSILHAWLHKNCPCYYHFFTERWANKHARLEVDDECRLSFKR